MAQGGHMESPGALAWLGHCAAQDGHCGLPGYPAHPGFHGHPRDVPPWGLGCGGPGVSREGLSGGSSTVRGLCPQHEGWPGVRGARRRCPEGVPGRSRQDWGLLQEGRTCREGRDISCAPGRCVGQGPSIPLHGNRAGHGTRASIPPREGSRGHGGQRDVPLHPCLSWEAVAQLHLVVYPLMAAVALQPPLPRCHLVCDGGSPVWGSRPQPQHRSLCVGELLILLLPQERFKQSQCCRAFAKRKKRRNVAEIPSVLGALFQADLAGLAVPLGSSPLLPGPRIPGILLAGCPMLRAWRGASLALLPRG